MKAIVGAHILTAAGKDFEHGIMLVEDGKFVAVGEGIEIPSGVEIVDATDKFITPGLIDAHTHIGLSSFSETSSPYTPSVRILDSIDLSDPGFEDALLSGVTSVIITPGSTPVVCGTSIAMKTAGSELSTRVLRDPAGMKMAWRKGTKLPSQDIPFPVSLMGIAGIIRNTLVETQNYLVQRERDQVPEDPGKEALAKVLRREIPIRMHCFTPVEIQAILRLKDEFGFDLTIEHGFESHFIAEELAERAIPVVYGPGPGLRRHKIFPFRGPHVPAILHDAGVKVCLQTDHPDRSITQLRLFGLVLLRYTDLTPEDVLHMLTINGAEVIGVADRIGSIEAGKDADFAVFSGHPMHIQSRVEQLYIDGEQVVKDGVVEASPLYMTAD